jgi:hypothetical protein
MSRPLAFLSSFPLGSGLGLPPTSSLIPFPDRHRFAVGLLLVPFPLHAIRLVKEVVLSNRRKGTEKKTLLNICHEVKRNDYCSPQETLLETSTVG